jgi:hypothetical protein
MRTALLLLAMVATSAFAGQTVWKWVDEQGVTHYSDRPMPGATKLELNVGAPTSDPAEAPSYSSNDRQSDQQDVPSGPAYRDFEIWKPSEGDTVVNTGGAVQVNIRIEPTLQPGHSIALYLDGVLVEGVGNALEHSLTEVPRGLHSLVAVVSDQRGRRVQETAQVQFSVRQSSIANPPVGPALRPPPKPRPRGAANKLPSEQPSYAAIQGSRPAIDPATNLPVKTKPAPKKKPKQP